MAKSKIIFNIIVTFLLFIVFFILTFYNKENSNVGGYNNINLKNNQLFEILKKDNIISKDEIISQNLSNTLEKNKIYYQNINNIDGIYFFTNDTGKNFEIDNNKNNIDETIELKEGIFILDIYDINKKYKIKHINSNKKNTLNIAIKSPGKIYIDTRNPKYKIFFSFDSIFELGLEKNKKITIFPNTIIKIDNKLKLTNKNFLESLKDINLEYIYDNIYTDDDLVLNNVFIDKFISNLEDKKDISDTKKFLEYFFYLNKTEEYQIKNYQSIIQKEYSKKIDLLLSNDEKKSSIYKKLFIHELSKYLTANNTTSKETLNEIKNNLEKYYDNILKINKKIILNNKHFTENYIKDFDKFISFINVFYKDMLIISNTESSEIIFSLTDLMNYIGNNNIDNVYLLLYLTFKEGNKQESIEEKLKIIYKQITYIFKKLLAEKGLIIEEKNGKSIVATDNDSKKNKESFSLLNSMHIYIYNILISKNVFGEKNVTEYIIKIFNYYNLLNEYLGINKREEIINNKNIISSFLKEVYETLLDGRNGKLTLRYNIEKGGKFEKEVDIINELINTQKNNSQLYSDGYEKLNVQFTKYINTLFPNKLSTINEVTVDNMTVSTDELRDYLETFEGFKIEQDSRIDNYNNYYGIDGASLSYKNYKKIISFNINPNENYLVNNITLNGEKINGEYNIFKKPKKFFIDTIFIPNSNISHEDTDKKPTNEGSQKAKQPIEKKEDIFNKNTLIKGNGSPIVYINKLINPKKIEYNDIGLSYNGDDFYRWELTDLEYKKNEMLKENGYDCKIDLNIYQNNGNFYISDIKIYVSNSETNVVLTSNDEKISPKNLIERINNIINNKLKIK